MQLNELTIKEAHEGLKKREFTSVELTRACLDQIEKLNKKINAFISVTEKQALEQAEEVDKRINQGKEIDILEGIPLAIKDNILVEGIRATAGSKMLENYVAPYNATVIEKLKEKGAVILGKTNMDEFAMGSSSETSHFGPVCNPCDLERVPGGSSGGSAAAVASHMCLGALGSDTGGSVRQPASFCGIVGLKPTYGRVSRYGLIAMASSLDQIGVLAKSVEDTELLLRAIEGKDKLDSTSVESNPKSKIPNPKPRKVSANWRILRGGQTQNPKPKTQNLRVGIPKECFEKGLDGEVKKTIEQAIDKFKKAGAEIIDINLPYMKYALACYYITMPAEVSSNLARYDGIKFGYSNKMAENLLEAYIQSRAEGFGQEVKRRIILGTFTLSAGYYDAYYKQAQKVRALIKKDFNQAFENVDLIITPTTPTTAFKIGEKIEDPLAMYLSDIYTVPVNLVGLPAISIPCGEADNLPVGLQIIGRQFDEDGVLGLARMF